MVKSLQLAMGDLGRPDSINILKGITSLFRKKEDGVAH